MCLAQGHNSDAGEARTNGPFVSSQILYHRVTVILASDATIRLSAIGMFMSVEVIYLTISLIIVLND